MIKNVMVTGSSGTVGTDLCLKLLVKGYNVIPVDIKPSLWDRSLDRKTIRHDLRKPLTGKSKPRQKADIIFHLAANARVHDLVIDPDKALDNYKMTHNILEYARINNIEKLVFSSSREVYGESALNKKRKESLTHVTRIKSPYTASKFAAEALIHSYAECYNIKPVIVRLSNVYGRYDVSERVIPAFIYLIQRNHDIKIFGKEKKLDFTYIDDATDGFLKIMRHYNRAAGHTFNLSRGQSARILDVARFIKNYFDSASSIAISTKRTGEISSFTGDISLAKKKFGYNPKVSIEDGITKNIEWLLQALKDRNIYRKMYRELKNRGMLSN